MDVTHLRQLVLENDPDRFLLSQFLPAAVRPAAWAVLSFNHEVAKTASAVSDVMIGSIRLQWWRDALDEIASGGPVRRHPVTEALAEISDQLNVRALHQLIDARMRDLEPEPLVGPDELKAYARSVNTPLLLQLDALSRQADSVSADGCAMAGETFGILGLIRSLPVAGSAGARLYPGNVTFETAIDAVLSDLRSADPAAAGTFTRLTLVFARVKAQQLKRAGYEPAHPALRSHPALMIPKLWMASKTRR